uniref:uncharacterized protein LOC120333063 n=1 Tax=Styela clava TaxID=7725 RepID=UPI00193A981A|nr:uncharacterized protein LOC120333063 [Styela clava]
MFEGFDTLSDILAMAYWKEFLVAFPNIKLILTMRERKSWVKSYINQLTKYNQSALSFPLSIFSPTARRWWDFHCRPLAKVCKLPTTKHFSLRKCFPIDNEETCLKFYDEYNDDVIKENHILLVLGSRDLFFVVPMVV